MTKKLAKKGALPNGRPDRETMKFRYDMLKELQRQCTPEVMTMIAQRAIADAITGDEKVVAQARTWLSQYVLPKVVPLINPEDLAQTNTQINTFVLNAPSDLLERILDDVAIETVDATVTNADTRAG
jgi:hypothetical protein